MERSKELSKLIAALFLLTLLSCGGGGSDPSRVVSGQYTLIAWNDLGMHCMDHDYSVFAILPPYNNLHAQLIDRTTGKLISSGVSLTYEATKDTHGSINSGSAGKTNFWDWVSALFGVQPAKDIGLAGNPAAGAVPSPMTFDSVAGFWKAEGIPMTPYDDNSNTNYYPMVKIVAKDLAGNVLATTKTVLPVSDEMSCAHCHASDTGDPAAQPDGGWVHDPDPGKDWKRNILKRHDDRNMGKELYTISLAQKGYDPAGLFATAASGRPILCANCHASNALGTSGVPGIKQLTTSVHSWHATNAMDDNTGMPLDNTTDRSACYNCHPGSTTQCLRGVMGNAKDSQGNELIQCQGCHGSMSKVGAATRAGWKDLPACQYCHYQDGSGNYTRDMTVFDSSGNLRQVTSIFTTGQNLYKIGAEHGGVQCEACHGSTHAEYSTTEPNDNLQSISLQGHAGTIAECSVCHADVPLTASGGPHGMHTLGQAWVDAHGNYSGNPAACVPCHGTDYRGTVLSKTSASRMFYIGDGGAVAYSRSDTVGCYDCHDFPQ